MLNVTTKKITLKNGAIATCTATRGSQTRTIWADGHQVEVAGDYVDTTVLDLVLDGKKLNDCTHMTVCDPTNKFHLPHIAKGAYALLWSTPLSKSTYGLMQQLLQDTKAEADTPAILAHRAKKDAAYLAEIGLPMHRGNGWCNRCKSNCYGDCTAH